MKKNVTNCESCGGEIAVSAKSCPQCGAKVKRPVTKKWWFWAIIVVVVLGIIGGVSGSNSFAVFWKYAPDGFLWILSAYYFSSFIFLLVPKNRINRFISRTDRYTIAIRIVA